MCGIVGLIDLAGLDAAAARPRLARALAHLARRGPDGEGVWHDARALLGHRRLSIVDLSPAGAQPMRRDGLAIVFNGMIYNYRAVRAELAALGERFASDCDTEVLLVGWRRWGRALLPRLEGIFAFALWDEAARALHLARDRFGKKPLFLRRRGRALAFASDLRALQFIDGDRGAVDPASLRLYFALGYLPEPRAILEGVEKLPPGHIATFDAAGFAMAPWFRLAEARAERPADPAAAALQIRAAVERAVADRLVADVPVGAFLSGGIDSSIVAACMARAAGDVRTFTVGFADVPEYYEERPGARRVARHLGTRHTEIEVSAADALASLDAVFDRLDEPFGDSSALPTFVVARETRRHVTVALSGDGGDEVFAGYRKHQGELYAERYRALPAWLRRGIVEPLARLLPEGKGAALLEQARRLRRFVAHAGGAPAARHAGWTRLCSEAELDALFQRPAAAPTVESLVAAREDAGGSGDPINAMLDADLGLVLPGDMLVKVDRMGMGNALEVRSPLLDSRVVALARALPGAWKLRPGRGKAILRDAFTDALPAELFQRPKKGFELPVAEWLRGPLAARARDAVDPARLAREGWLKPGLPARWWAEHAGGRRDRARELWALIAFAAWQDRQVGP
jgi:asparagine synthase (glutamine-hydrolysing)